MGMATAIPSLSYYTGIVFLNVNDLIIWRDKVTIQPFFGYISYKHEIMSQNFICSSYTKELYFYFSYCYILFVWKKNIKKQIVTKDYILILHS